MNGNLWLSILLSGMLPACEGCSQATDRVGSLCVGSQPAGSPEGPITVAYLNWAGAAADECISSGRFKERPVVVTIDSTSWKVEGTFVEGPAGRPLTPDCMGGLVSHTLGVLKPGRYEIKSSKVVLKFSVPLKETPICQTAVHP